MKLISCFVLLFTCVTLSFSTNTSTITVLSPNGGESWMQGYIYEVRWTQIGLTTVKIEFSSNGGSTWQLIIEEAPAKTKIDIIPKYTVKPPSYKYHNESVGSYLWLVPIIETNNAIVRISSTENPSIFDVSNSPFQISDGPPPPPYDDWTRQYPPISSAIYSVKTVSSQLGWACGANGTVIKTTNGGTNWIKTSNPSNLSNFAIEASHGITAYVAANGANDARIYRTTNSGTSWTLVYHSTISGSYINAIKMFDQNNGIAIGDPIGVPLRYLLLRTTDAGSSWSEFGELAPGSSTEIGLNNSMFWLNPNCGWFGTNDSRIYLTTNRGENWSWVRIPSNESPSIWFKDSLNGILGLNDISAITPSIAKSSDGGVTWANKITILGRPFGLSGSSDDVWATNRNDIIRSSNFGAGWRHEYFGFGARTLFHLSMIKFEGFNYGWAVGDNGTVLRYGSTSTNGMISGLIFDDLNGNGVFDQDGSENGLPNWKTYLSGPFSDSVTTIIHGLYTFQDLMPGNYIIQTENRNGWIKTFPPSGQYNISVNNDWHTWNNFGVFKLGTITGFIWHDLNGNGIWERGEPGISGRKVKLAGGRSDSVLSSPGGWYRFENLHSGTYFVSTEIPIGWAQTFLSDSLKYTIKISLSGQDVGNAHGTAVKPNFGQAQNTSILNGYCWHDLNCNGFWDTDENPKPNVKIFLSSISLDSTTTNDSGFYQFTNLLAGTYFVNPESRAEGKVTFPLFSDSHRIDLLSGSVIFGANYQTIVPNLGLYKYGTLSGIVFYDRNNNGVQDIEESGLSNWEIKLSGVNTPVRSTLTHSNGRFEFTNLVADNYTLTETINPKWVNTVAPGMFVIRSGSVIENLKFGNFLRADSIKYRSFLHTDIMELVKDKPVKAIKRKPNQVEVIFNLTYPGDFIGLRMEWSAAPLGTFAQEVKKNGIVLKLGVNYDYTVTGVFDGKNKKFDYLFKGPLVNGDVITIRDYVKAQKPIKAKYAFMTHTPGNLYMIQVRETDPKFEMNLPRLQMPNYINVLEEVYADGAFATDGGMLVGVRRPDALKDYGWLLMPKAADVYKTLWDKTGYHTSDARFFDEFSNSGKPLVKLQKSLPPTKHNNKLLAEIIALKLAIAASATKHTPLGFGELIYADSGNVLHLKMLKAIADTVSKAMTHYSGNPGDYVNYYNVIRRINEAFAGPIDTVSFAAKTVMTGVRQVADIPYLLSNQDVPKTVITPSVRQYGEVPEVFELAQNYPNPFNPSTTIEFTLPEDAMVTLKVYNILGQEVAALINNELYTEGRNDVEFDAGKLSSGVYFYRLTAEGLSDEGQRYIQIKKMLLLR